MIPNFVIFFVAALVPLITGFLWYHPKVFGTAWMKSIGFTEESMKGANMGLIFGLTYVLSVLLSGALYSAVVHQGHLYSILVNETGFGQKGSEIDLYLTDFISKYGENFRTFKHGVLHGTIVGFLFAVPVLGINALFERRGFKYIAINGGYWIVTLALMGGILCAYA